MFKKKIHLIFRFDTSYRIDTGDDGRISKKEFCSDKMAVKIKGWTGVDGDLEREFDSIDTNGGGQILFKVRTRAK